LRLFGREARAFSIFAGSEEIMIDQGVKMSVKDYQKILAKQNKARL